MTDALSILKRNHLSNTDSRRAILEIFLQSDNALAHNDIERITGDRFDRVTVYRTLQTFIDKGIVHTIPTGDNATRYALCRENCSEGHHHDDHVHFICEVCGRTTCLDDTHIPPVKLPKGYTPTQINMIVNGVCPDCK
ncbi:MAG TPA: Fur family transcriptional regulator [Chitinophagaceae bacterium]|nr:Fur family transcriptional regulator [Chitinophagaceae bacterium]